MRNMSYKFKNQELIKNGKGPKPNFWRAMTDNDFGNHMEVQSIAWKEASINPEIKKLDIHTLKNGDVTLNITYKLPVVETTFVSIYTIKGNGVIKIENTLNTTTYKGDIPRIGMRMQIPKAYYNLTYFGRGPWENYQDRNASAFLDIYKSSVSDPILR